MDSQKIEERFAQDIKEIKVSLKELATMSVTIALQNQRMDTFDARLAKAEENLEESWDTLREIHTTCKMRESVYKKGLQYFEEHGMHDTPDTWLNQLIGGAVRNGIWIAAAALITAMITRWM